MQIFTKLTGFPYIIYLEFFPEYFSCFKKKEFSYLFIYIFFIRAGLNILDIVDKNNFVEQVILSSLCFNQMFELDK